MSNISQHQFADREELADQLSQHIVQQLASAITARGYASLVVSGGSTSVPLFKRLAATALPWKNVSITLADERWVAIDSDRSNEYLVRQHLLQHRAAKARFISLKTTHAAPELAEDELNARIAQIPHPFDVVLLGIGNDGHTASLFPDAPQLQAGLTTPRACIGIHPGSTPEARLSLSLSSLLDAREIIFALQGADKQSSLQKALGGADVVAMPVRAVLLQNRTPVSVYWAP